MPALTGAVALAAALLLWFVVVSPVNAHWAAAGPGTVPPAFESPRARLKWGHAAHAALLFVAFLALVVFVLVEITSRAVARAHRSAAERAA